jgi:hypothetical protein
MYYIYHIPGIKIGCTNNPNRRVKEQGYSNFEILEKHTDIMIASNREIELQNQYGYKKDDTPYHITANAPNRKSSKLWASKLGKIQGKKNVENGHLSKVRNPSLAGYMSTLKDNHITKQTFTCPHCGKIGKSGAMKQWHMDNCKLKP